MRGITVYLDKAMECMEDSMSRSDFTMVATARALHVDATEISLQLVQYQTANEFPSEVGTPQGIGALPVLQ